MMKYVLPLFVMFGVYSTASAQSWTNDRYTGIWEEPWTTNGDWASRQDLVQMCSRLAFQSDREECYQIVNQGFYSRVAVEVCGSSPFASDVLSCLQRNVNVSMQWDAGQVCRRMTFDSDKKACLSVIGNKYYESYELASCSRETFDSDKVTCLRQLGRHGGGYPSPRPRPNPNPYPSPVDPYTCTVYNSSSYVTTVTRSHFDSYVRNFALRERSCVVSNYHNESHSRTLVSSTGRVLGSNLSEAETTRLKKTYGLDRCRILTCK